MDAQPETSQPDLPEVEQDIKPLMRLRLSFLQPSPPSTDNSSEKVDWRGATLTVDFLEGQEYSVMEAFWKCLLTKAGLLGRIEPSRVLVGRGGRAGRGRRGGS